jgi:hypothetical protein
MGKQGASKFALGDSVRLPDGDVGVTGVIVALLESDRVTVQWSDCSVPTTHGSRGLEIAPRYKE